MKGERGKEERKKYLGREGVRGRRKGGKGREGKKEGGNREIGKVRVKKGKKGKWEVIFT